MSTLIYTTLLAFFERRQTVLTMQEFLAKLNRTQNHFPHQRIDKKKIKYIMINAA